jgi:hypothetical protein
MLYLTVKAALSGIIIAIVSEVARRSPTLGALIVSLRWSRSSAFSGCGKTPAMPSAVPPMRNRHSGMCSRRCRCFC